MSENRCQRHEEDPVVPLHRPDDSGADAEDEDLESPYWLGPVADTVLVDFLFYGLFLAVPVLLMWAVFGRWWIFRNFEWVALGLVVWFVIAVGWRRKRAGDP